MEEKLIGKYSIVGFPDELGVAAVNGRLGTSQGPQSFLDAFERLRGHPDLQERCRSKVLVSVGNDIEVNHLRAAERVESLASDVIVAVGGGHDYGYSWIKGLSQGKGKSSKTLGCINLDAHFDLRPYHEGMTSGSPFRRLIEERVISPRNLIEFGIQAHGNSKDLWDYAAKMKIRTVPFEKLRNGKAVPEFKKALSLLKKTCNEIVISLDLDSLSFAYAPGVSAPQAEGFTASEVFQMLEIAGSDKKVTSLGIFELSPPLDFQNYTSRLAAQSAWHYLAKKFTKKGN